MVRTMIFVAIVTLSAPLPLSAQSGYQRESGGESISNRSQSRLLPFVRLHDDAVRPGDISGPEGRHEADAPGVSDSICSFFSLAQHGEIAPNTGGGTLNPLAFFNPATINSSRRIAFYSLVSGSDRNQGIFTADSAGLTAVAIGCGGGGGSGDPGTGCGDPSPIGGTFSGFFGGTVFAPAVNEPGDVLFLCDVDSGSAPRGLFLYQNAAQAIVTVAAVGDPSPLGGTFSAIGPGSLNSKGTVVFLASTGSTINSDIFMWQNGVVSTVAAVGDPAPGGGTFSALGTESFGFVDGTNIPAGPVPDINDADQICFRAIASGSITERGIVVRTTGTDEWYVKTPDPTPIGGTYFDMQAASINEAGQIAFFADYKPTPSTFSSGWFAGKPNEWRKVIVFFDSVDTGQCLGLAFSRNPMQTIDEEGNVVFWTNLSGLGDEDRMVVGMSDGTLLIAARRGDPSPIGGTIGSMDAWPATAALSGTLNASTPGAGGGALSAHMAFTRCGTLVSAEERGQNPAGFRLLQNYPNPFNPVTRIAFDVATRGLIVLKIYDLLGREIATLVNEPKSPGAYKVVWDAAGRPSGTYFCRLSTAGSVQTRKLILLR